MRRHAVLLFVAIGCLLILGPQPLRAEPIAFGADTPFRYPRPGAEAPDPSSGPGPCPPQTLLQTHPTPHYGFDAPCYPWGWFGAHYYPRKCVHRGVRHDKIEWTVRRGYW